MGEWVMVWCTYYMVYGPGQPLHIPARRVDCEVKLLNDNPNTGIVMFAEMDKAQNNASGLLDQAALIATKQIKAKTWSLD